MEVKRIANEIDEKPLCPSLTYMKQLEGFTYAKPSKQRRLKLINKPSIY